MSFDPAAIQALDTTGTAPQMWLTATKIVYDSFLAKAWKLPYLQAAYSLSRPLVVILWNQTCHIAGHFSDFMAHASPRLWLCACMAGEAWKSQTQLPSFHIRSYRVPGITLAWHPYCPKCRASPKSQIFKIPFLLQITSRMKASASWSKLQSSTFLQTPFPNFKWKLETPAEFCAGAPVQQNVGSLQIPMHNPLWMEMRHTTQQLTQEALHLCHSETLLGDEYLEPWQNWGIKVAGTTMTTLQSKVKQIWKPRSSCSMYSMTI